MKKIVKKSKKPRKVSNKNLQPKYIDLRGLLSFFILHELSRKGLSGDALARLVGERKASGTVLTPGTIYPALKRLRQQKLIKYAREGRKKVYFLTNLGKNELDAIYAVFGLRFSGIKSRLKR
jgi:DNA-binding PadR family transcriptional regulator